MKEQKEQQCLAIVIRPAVSRPAPSDLEAGQSAVFTTTCSFAPQNPTAPPASSNDKSFGNFWKGPGARDEARSQWSPIYTPLHLDDGTEISLPDQSLPCPVH